MMLRKRHTVALQWVPVKLFLKYLNAKGFQMPSPKGTSESHGDGATAEARFSLPLMRVTRYSTPLSPLLNPESIYSKGKEVKEQVKLIHSDGHSHRAPF